MKPWMHRLASRLVPLVAIALLVVAMGGTWLVVPRAGAAPLDLVNADHRGDVSSAVAPTPTPTSAPAAARAVPGARSPRRNAAPAGAAVGAVLVGKVNLNTATVDELERLPSIGPAKAARVVLWRQLHGGFRRTADLRRVKGIGYKTFQRLAPYLDVSGATTLGAAAPSPSP